MNLFSIDYLENLKTKILKMTEIEWENIFDIIKRENISYTKNNNGIFINMKELNENSIEDINKIVEYYDIINLNHNTREKTLENINN